MAEDASRSYAELGRS
ncbi:hypothetical protein [Paracoccus mutanolyticus]|nr:hypothetical protein [Paracoccus mutanolyticus]